MHVDATNGDGVRRNRASSRTRVECILANLILTAACASTSVTVLSTDPKRLDIDCGGALGDCHKRAQEECPNGYTVVDGAAHSGAIVYSAGSKYAPGVIPVHTNEIIVECGQHQELTASGSAPSSGEGPRNSIVASSAPSEGTPAVAAPKNAAGFSFGESSEKARGACEGSGLVWTEGKAGSRCSGTPVDTGLGAEAKVRFCKGEVCKIDVVVRPDDGAPALTAKRLEKAVSALTSKYGPPSRHDVTYTADCNGATLPACLKSGAAHFWYEWSWEGRQKIVLSLGSKKTPEAGQSLDPTVVNTMHIRYEDGRIPEGAPGSPESATKTTSAEVNGL